MTDKELSEFGEKLYEAILMTPLPGGTIFGIASAIRHGTPWRALPGSLKLAVFKIAANCMTEDDSSLNPGEVESQQEGAFPPSRSPAIPFVDAAAPSPDPSRDHDTPEGDAERPEPEAA